MESMITLGIDRMEIDWGKNHTFINHSILFTENDIKQIPYYYLDDETDSEIVQYKEGLSCKLSIIKTRLNLIGYSMIECKNKYDEFLHECFQYGMNINLDFDAFYNIIVNIDVSKFNTPLLEYEDYENGYDLGEFARKCILGEKEIRDNFLDYYSNDSFKMLYDLELFFENLNPYIILRLLAENKEIQDLEVFWSYSDVVERGWVSKDEILKFSKESIPKIIVVTEGSSDTFVLKKTIDTLFPEISHMFQFIDMQENYPFTGIGNLYNFCCGLIKIGIINPMIVIFDNDTAGLEKYEKLMKMPQLNNLLITKLPNYPDFSSIETVGPQGESVENINGLAVSIECFLDFSGHNPQVRWTSYNDKMKCYQGALINKDSYVSDFKSANLLDGSYKTEKLIVLIKYLLNEWETRNTVTAKGSAVQP